MLLDRLFKPKPKTPEQLDLEQLNEKERAALTELEQLTESLLESLRTDMEAGAIGTVLGVDGAGRLPALLLSKAISQIQQNHGHGKVITRFIRGRKYQTPRAEKELEQYIQQLNLPKDKKVLIVDDVLFGGRTLENLTIPLFRAGYTSDIAVLFAYPHSAPVFSNKIHAADKQTRGEPLIGGVPTIGGVAKDRAELSTDLFAKPNYQEHQLPYLRQSFYKIPPTRRTLNKAAERIVAEFEQNSVSGKEN